MVRSSDRGYEAPIPMPVRIRPIAAISTPSRRYAVRELAARTTPAMATTGPMKRSVTTRRSYSRSRGASMDSTRSMTISRLQRDGFDGQHEARLRKRQYREDHGVADDESVSAAASE